MRSITCILFAVLFGRLALLNLHAQSLYFPPKNGEVWEEQSPEFLNWCEPGINALYDMLEAENTKAFILLKDGRIVLEKYFGSHTQATPWYWASAGKTLTAFAVGIARQEELLSIDDMTSAYLGEGWTACLSQEEQGITIRHQLTMTSGLDDGAEDHFCTLPACLSCIAVPGTRWAYHNAPYTLLDQVIESATGKTLNGYITEKIGIPTGMTGMFVSVGYNNVFFSNARSMARFGLLVLNKGNWAGNQILQDSEYFEQMVNSSQSLNEAYGYLWWLNGKSTFRLPGTQVLFNGAISPNAPADMIAAIGKNGQFLNIVPSQNLIWLRLGDSPDGSEVPFLLNDKIWKHINKLECVETAALSGQKKDFLRVWPNPVNEMTCIETDAYIERAELYTLWGQLLKVIPVYANRKNISFSDIERGVYVLRLISDRERVYLHKLIKE